MKKVISISTITLIVCLVAVLLVSGSIFKIEAETLTEGYYTYTVSNGEATITGYTGEGNDVVIPSRLGGYPVTTISENVFYPLRKYEDITRVQIDDYEEGEDFEWVNWWLSIKFENEYSNPLIYGAVLVDSDGAYVVDMEIPDGFTSIGQYAFIGCISLQKAVIPKSVTSIGESAFEGNYSLEEVLYEGESQDEIDISEGNYRFTSASWNYNYCYESSYSDADKSHKYDNECDSTCNTCGKTLREVIHSYEWIVDVEPTSTETGLKHEECTLCGVTRNEDTVIEATGGDASSDFTYEIVDGEVIITGYIGDGGAVVIPAVIDGYPVTTIGEEAFCNRTSITSIEIPDSITSIGHNAFYDCTNLTSVYITDLASWCEIDFYTLWDDAYSNPLCCGGDLFMKGSRKPISDLVIPDGVTAIGNFAFSWCGSLTSIVIPESVTTIGYRAFSYCDSLTSVTIPNSVTIIGGYAFNWCRSLASVDIGSGVTIIGDGAFYDCDNLTSVDIGSGVTTIGDYAFGGCWNLMSIDIPDSVITIGEEAFYNCYWLTKIAIPDSVTTLGGSVFGSCSGLTSVDIGSGISAITNQFKSCTSIKTLTITKNLVDMDYDSFGSSSIETIYFEGTRDEWNNMVYAQDSQFVNANIIFVCSNHSYEWIIDVEPTATTTGLKHEECTLCGATRNENTVIEVLDKFALEIVGTDIVKKGDTIVLTVVLSGCENGTSYGVEVDFGGKIELIEGIMGRTDGISKFDTETNKGSYAYTNGVTDLNGTVLTLTFEGVEPSAELEEITVHLIVKNSSTELYNGTVTKSVKVICDEHSFSEWTQTIAPTCIVSGEKIRTCEVCGESETVVVEATGIHLFDSEDDEQCNTCDYIRYVAGDFDGDDVISDSDAIYLLLHTYFPETYPVSQPCDYDGNGTVNDQDAIHLLFYTYFPESYPIPEAPKYEIIALPKDDGNYDVVLPEEEL